MIEIIGIVATLFILIAFCLTDIRKIRIVDTIGAILFVIYGILINSLSVWILNLALIGVNIYKLYKERNINNEKDK